MTKESKPVVCCETWRDELEIAKMFAHNWTKGYKYCPHCGTKLAVVE